MNNILAIIPARKDSKGVLNKNIKLLGKHPLIAYSIAAAKLAGIRNVIVSTDSSKYRKIAEKYGAKVPFLRPSNISKDYSTDYQFVIHFLKWMKKNKINFPKYLIHLRPTTPIRDPKIIKKAIKFIKSKKESTSLRSAHRSAETFMKWCFKNKSGYFARVNKKMSSEKIGLPRQKFRSVFIPNGYVDILKSHYVYKNKKLIGNKMLVFETSRCIEVDENYDFKILNLLIEKSKNKLIRYLNKYN